MEKYTGTLFVFGVLIIVCQACDPGWESFEGSCYKYFAERKTWNDSKTYCESINGHLTIVMSYAENDFLKALLRRLGALDQIWMDGDDLKSENHFERANTGEELEIYDWGPNEPNQTGNEDCITFYRHKGYRWNDEHCDKTFGFLCEKDNATATESPGVVG